MGFEMIPDYIREHILHAQPPDGCCVPEGSIPDVAEGHFYSARVATVGINPHGIWKREDYLPRVRSTLDEDDLDEQLLNRVWEEKTRYIERNTHRYFTALKPILNACGVTYGGKYGADQPDLACSLDLVQWATNPLWNKLPTQCSPMLKVSCSTTPRRSLRNCCRRTRISNCCWATVGPSQSSYNGRLRCDSPSGRSIASVLISTVGTCWAGDSSAGAPSCRVHR